LGKHPSQSGLAKSGKCEKEVCKPFTKQAAQNYKKYLAALSVGGMKHKHSKGEHLAAGYVGSEREAGAAKQRKQISESRLQG